MGERRTFGRETDFGVPSLGLPGQHTDRPRETGAAPSIYSSEAAREEFPTETMAPSGRPLRWRVGRRLMDPLAELVKLDPSESASAACRRDVDPARDSSSRSTRHVVREPGRRGAQHGRNC